MRDRINGWHLNNLWNRLNTTHVPTNRAVVCILWSWIIRLNVGCLVLVCRFEIYKSLLNEMHTAITGPLPICRHKHTQRQWQQANGLLLDSTLSVPSIILHVFCVYVLNTRQHTFVFVVYCLFELSFAARKKKKKRTRHLARFTNIAAQSEYVWQMRKHYISVSRIAPASISAKQYI